MKSIRYLVLLVLCSLSSVVHAQQNGSNRLNAYQDSLIKRSDLAANALTDDQKFAENGKFVKTLVDALKQPNSFYYPFDSLKRVSIIKSPDQIFRIISWYLPLENGGYRYYGSIQINSGGALKLFPLIDQTEALSNQNAVTDNKKWFGARYYEIIPVSSPGRRTFYALLGWKGNNQTTTKKVIEILNLERESVSFGAPVFDGKELKDTNRIVFEYNKNNAMILKSDPKTGMILYEHLAPFEADMVGKFEFYGSDGDFDGFKIIGGRLKKMENLDLKNDPDVKDEFYADPKKNVRPVKKF